MISDVELHVSKTDLASVSLLPASHPREDVRSLLLVFFRFDDIS